MKKIYSILQSILVLSLFFTENIQAQQVLCGTPPPTPAEIQYILNNIATVPIHKNGGTTCIPIQMHIVRETNGTGGISLADVHEGVAYLNEYYFPAGIEFYFCGTGPNFIDNSQFYDFQSTEEGALALAAGENNNAINMYFVDEIDNTGGPSFTAGYAYAPANAVQSTRIVLRNDNVADGSTIVHEMGHHFALLHTFETAVVPLPGGGFGGGAELVNGSNCTTAGDIICDTPADPGFNGTNVNLACQYVGTATDANNDLYNPMIENVMSYYPTQCQNPFVLTPEQINRIQQGLTVRQGHTAYDMSCPASNVTNPSALTGSFVGATVVLNWTDNSNNETGFFIERSEVSATAGFEAFGGFGVGPNTTTFTDNAINVSNTYWYRVKASNDGCNDYSNVIQVGGATPCAITAISAGTQSACDPTSNTYTQAVIITYNNAPGGTIDVNGQTFAVGTSPQNVTLTGLPANGNNVSVTAFFTNETTCTFTNSNAFTAPASCATSPCAITAITAGVQSACDPTTDTYTQEVTITYSNPSSANIVVNGQTFAVTSSPQTVVLSGLAADGNPVDVTAGFTGGALCELVVNNLFTAPASCASSCIVGDVNPALAGDTFDYCPGTVLELLTDSNEVVPTGEAYLWVFINTTDTVFVNTGGSYSGDINAALVGAGGTAIPFGSYLVYGLLTENGGTAICNVTPGDFIVNVLDATDPICSGAPVCSAGDVATSLNGTTVDYCPGTNITLQTDGNDNILAGEAYLWVFINATDTVFVNVGPNYSGDINTDIVAGGGTAIPSGSYTVFGLTTQSGGAAICDVTPGDFTINVLDANDPACLNPCAVNGIALSTQSVCDPTTNTYTQELIVTYTNEPTSGTLDVNGQSFPITGSPQTVTLTGLLSDGNPVTAYAEFSNSTSCNYTEFQLFTAPQSCAPNPCNIIDVVPGVQTFCDSSTNTYTQELTLTYANPPAGTINVNGQTFPVSSSPQTITLSNLPANGSSVAISAFFTSDPTCSFNLNNAYNAPNSCLPAGTGDSLVVIMYPNGVGTLNVGNDVITNTPFTGYYPVNALLDISATPNTGEVFNYWRLNNQSLLDFSPTTSFVFIAQDTLFAYFNGSVGIDDLGDELADFMVYPTLVNNQLIVEFTPVNDADLRLDIYSLDGKLVKNLLDGRFIANQHFKNVFPIDLASGMYFVKGSTAKKSFSTRIIVY